MPTKKVKKKIAGTPEDLRKRKVARTPQNSTISPIKTKSALVRKQVIRDRAAGLTLYEIAEKNDISHNQCYIIIRDFLRNVMSPDADQDMMNKIWMRYEMLVEANMPRAMLGGKLGKEAAEVVLNASAGMRKMFCLDKEKPKQVEVTGQIAILSPEDNEL